MVALNGKKRSSSRRSMALATAKALSTHCLFLGHVTSFAASTSNAFAIRPSTVIVIDPCARSIWPTQRALTLPDRSGPPGSILDHSEAGGH